MLGYTARSLIFENLLRSPVPWLSLILANSVAAAHGAGRGEGDPSTERRMVATRASGPIVLDAVFDEQDWIRSSVANHFIQSDPQEGEPATYDTEVRVLYDDENLYIGMVALDKEPDKLVVNDLRRDFTTRSGDTFGIILDTFHDHRNGYMFQTNPRGAKWDAQFFNEGRELNRDWNGVWHVAARTTGDGWVAEIAIPFTTLRFKRAPVQSWGLNFMRRIRRLNEDSHWSPIPRIHRSSRVSLAGNLEDLRDLSPGADIKVTPFLTGEVSQSGEAPAEGDFDGGVDAKLAVGTGLTMDLTLNTDFSQVEADQQQVNLTRFSLFFPEKRDFFLENSGIFRFGPPPGRAGPAVSIAVRHIRRQLGLSGRAEPGGGSAALLQPPRRLVRGRRPRSRARGRPSDGPPGPL